MPVQDLRRAPTVVRALGPAPIRVIFARAIALAGTLGITGYGVYEMLGIVDFARMTLLQGVLLFFFTITLAWIAFAAASAI
ncbi:MAG: glucan biosynthesis glucosyltransferase H, partial [Steroidobacter sp.]